MASLVDTIQKNRFFPSLPIKDNLPISQTNGQANRDDNDINTHIIGLRRRISSFSVHIQPISHATTEWAFRRTKSMPSIKDFTAGPLRKWWDWGVSWIMSKKPSFARDLEMNEDETAMLGCHSKGSWRHVFYKVRAEIRKLLGHDKLPMTQKFKYDSFNYAQNFDNGDRQEQRDMI